MPPGPKEGTSLFVVRQRAKTFMRGTQVPPMERGSEISPTILFQVVTRRGTPTQSIKDISRCRGGKQWITGRSIFGTDHDRITRPSLRPIATRIIKRNARHHQTPDGCHRLPVGRRRHPCAAQWKKDVWPPPASLFLIRRRPACGEGLLAVRIVAHDVPNFRSFVLPGRTMSMPVSVTDLAFSCLRPPVIVNVQDGAAPNAKSTNTGGP